MAVIDLREWGLSTYGWRVMQRLRRVVFPAGAALLLWLVWPAPPARA